MVFCVAIAILLILWRGVYKRGLKALRETLATARADTNNYKQLTEGQGRELEKYRRFEHYTHLPVPNEESMAGFQRYLAALGSNEFFMFYILTLENEIIANFAGGAPPEFARGAVHLINRIRSDVKTEIANQAVREKHAEV